MRRRVAITGIGAVTPLGNDAETTWAGLIAGRSGVGPLTTFDCSAYPVRIAGLVKDFDLDREVTDHNLSRHLSRAPGFGLAASLEAVRNSGLTVDSHRPDRVGIALGGHAGRPLLEDLVEIFRVQSESGPRRLVPQMPSRVVMRDQNTALAVLGLIAHCQGPPISVSTACTGSSHAVGEAFRRIQEGDAEVMVAGGYDSLTTYLDVLGFSLLGALTDRYNDDPERASRPFDRDRSGFVVGEGGVSVVLEEWEAAHARGAPILAELTGYGSSMNAFRITDSPPDGGGAILAMANALADGGTDPTEVGCIVAHGTSTPGNDISETVAIKAVFGEHAANLVVTAPKSMTGHLTSAAGSLNLLAAVFAIRDSVVPPTINLEHPDPKLDLDYVPNQARRLPVNTAMVNAFAFGGTNACLVVRAAPAPG
jgi:3-oxoacyl-[acyl-carrier-protein] synthase II